MANEFEFLRARWPKLAALGADAARLVDFSPVTALSTLRDYCEWAADIALDLLGNPLPPETPQLERLSALKAMGMVSPDILQKFYNIQATEDRVGGNPLGDPNEARARISDAIDIGRWILRQGGGYAAQPSRGYTGSYTTGEDAYASGRQDNTAYSGGTMGYNPGNRNTGNDYPQPEQNNYDPDYDDNGGYQNGYANDQADYPEPQGGRFSGFNLLSIRDWFLNLWDRCRGSRALPVAIAAVLLIILLIVLITVLSRCSGTGAATTTTTTVKPSETFSMLITPSPTPTATPTPPPAATVKYVDEFDSADITKSHTAWTNYYLGKWTANSHNANFSIYNGGSGTDAAGVEYEHGLGWFVKSGDFDGDSARRALTFKTNGQYSTLSFDMGIDHKWLFDDAENCGTYRILVFVDGQDEAIYTTDWVNYNYYKTGIEVDVTGAQEVKIRLEQKKGNKGSLNVVLGNCGFTEAVAATTPAASETTTTTAVEETTTAVEETTAAE